jgi:rhodanese-related sulfurtransferase
MSREEFIEVVTAGQTAPPAYFSYDATLNRELRPLLDESTPPAEMDLAEVLEAQADGAVIVDTRGPENFALAHITGSVNIGMAGRYAEFAGGVITPDTPMIIVADEGSELEAKNRLARIGFDNVLGALAAPLTAMALHPDAVSRSSRVDVRGLREAMGSVPGLQLLDVRQPGETAGGVIEGAIQIPLTRLNAEMDRLDKSAPTIVYCAGGFRSSIAASQLTAHGFADVSDLLGGYTAWEAAHEPAG